MRRATCFLFGVTMGWFGKPKKTVTEAACEFIFTYTAQIKIDWPEICKRLQEIEPKFETLKHDVMSSFEFLLAAISIQLHALSNLQNNDTGEKIRETILELLSTDNAGTYPLETIAEYDEAWNDFVEKSAPPFFAVSWILIDKLKLTKTVTLGNQVHKDPILVMSLGRLLVEFSGKFWKLYLAKYKIVSDR